MGNSWRIFVSLFVTYAFFTNFYVTTNESPRFSLTEAIVEEHRLEIDSFYNRTRGGLAWDAGDLTMARWFLNIDYAIYNDHVYSDKAPLGSFLAVPFYLAARFFSSDPWVLFYISSVFVCGLLTALTGVLVYLLGRYYTRDENLRVLAAFAYGFGTMAFTYATVLFSHAISTFFVYASFYLIYRVKKRDISSKCLYLSGFLAGLAVLSDYYMALVGVCLLAYCWSFDRKGSIKMLLSFAIALCALLLYNYAVFGNPLAVSYSFEESPVFRQGHSQGFFGVGLLNWDALIQLLISPYRGLFFYNPVLILSVLLFARFFDRDKSTALLVAVVSLLMILFNASYYMWDGGLCVGPRHLTSILPFLILPLYCLDLRKLKERLAFGGLLIASVALNFIYVNARMHVPPFDVGPFRLAVPLIPYAPNALNQVFLMHGVPMSFTTSILIVFFVLALWSREIGSFLKEKSGMF